MATKKYIAECLLAIKAVFPYFAKDTDERVLAKIWFAVLAEYPDNLISEGLKNCLQTLSVPPTPADIIKAAQRLYEPSSYERFALLIQKLRIVEREEQRFGYTFVEDNGKTQGENARAKVEYVWDTMPSDLKHYLGSLGEMIRLSRDLSDEALTFERNRFEKFFATQPKSSVALIESFNKAKSLSGQGVKELK